MTCGCSLCTERKKNTDIAVDELRRKLVLEGQFKREIRSIFNQMVDDFKVSVSARGRAQSVSPYLSNWVSSLKVQYARVQRSFRDEVLAQNGEKSIRWWAIKQNGDEQQINETIQLALLAWRDDTAPIQAEEINSTNDAELSKAVSDARQALIDDGQEPTNSAIAIVGARLLRMRFAGRVNTIAQTETQSSSEATKQISAEGLSGATPFPLRRTVIMPTPPSLKTTKFWDTVGDNRVRASHVSANGQSTILDGIFSVGQSRFRFAGDLGLNPALKDVINCRCSTRYEVDAS